ncbi:MAG: DEAD/DEAH box helicase family protein [Candidatus Thorarchaeota archaeon]
MGEELLEFVINGGRVRICCSPDLPEPDEDAAREGYDRRGTRSQEEQEMSLLEVMKSMSKNPDEADCLDMLRLLIETERLDLYIAIRSGGIYHRKVGAFLDDEGNVVVFSGSGNETPNAITSIENWGNDEEFDVFRNWGGEFETSKADKKKRYLERLFENGSVNTRVRPINQVERDYLNQFRSHRDLEDCRQGARKRSSSLTKSISRRESIEPYPYQAEAIEEWKRHDCVGMLSMATGTGKTLTALFAIEDFLKNGNPILILVPSNILLSQWLDNIRKVYPDVPIMCAGGGYEWKTNPIKRMFILDLERPRIILATMQTASSEDFMQFFSQANNSVLVADEAHRLGSTKFRRIMDIDFKARLGLSATPERLFDTEGSMALIEAFGENLVYDLPLGANVKIEEGKSVPILGNFLSRYYYRFEQVGLTHEEKEEWVKLTAEIKREFAISISNQNAGSDFESNKKLKHLLIQRARIAKNAGEKVDKAIEIIEDRYPAEGHWLIYCDNLSQLKRVADGLRESFPHIVVLEYHSEMNRLERNRVIDFFERDPSIIVSIKCLDEGVDVPRADGAIILASSTNPREYIQRRGRVLRKAKGKNFATIVDVLVLPGIETGEDEISMSLVKSELARSWEFAGLSENCEIKHELWKICQEYGVDPEMDRQGSLESEEVDE